MNKQLDRALISQQSIAGKSAFPIVVTTSESRSDSTRKLFRQRPIPSRHTRQMSQQSIFGGQPCDETSRVMGQDTAQILGYRYAASARYALVRHGTDMYQCKASAGGVERSGYTET